MKKYINFISAIVSIIVLTTACSDSFLDEKVLDKYAPESLTDKLGFEASLIGLYNSLSTMYTTDQDQTFIVTSVVGTDEVWAPAGRSNGMARPFFDYSQLISTDSGTSKIWTSLYKIINNANIIIKSAESGTTIGMSQAELDAFKAEAYFFRSYSYNMLATLFGGVPLVTEPITGAKTDFVRAPLQDVNDLIVSDLLFAIDHLPNVKSLVHKSRVHTAVANQLLAEVYLRLNKPDLAEKQCDAIFDSLDFKLITARFGVKANQPGDLFSDMFFFGNQRRSQGNTEVIWVIEQENTTDVPGGSSGNPQQRRVWVGAYYDLPGMVVADTLGGRGIGRIRLNNWVLYDLYKGNDMRNSKYNIHREHYFNNSAPKYSTVFGKKVPYGQDATFTLADNSQLKIFASDTIFKYAPYTQKWGHLDSRDIFGYAMRKDFIMMRLAETYLLRAEARLKQNNLQGAADDINVLRNRANASTVSQSDMTLDFILDERARELIGEENRRMTLVRTGTLVRRARDLTGTAPLAGGAIETTIGLQDFNVLLPIPQSEINLNKDAVLEQNPGYEN